MWLCRLSIAVIKLLRIWVHWDNGTLKEEWKCACRFDYPLYKVYYTGLRPTQYLFSRRVLEHRRRDSLRLRWLPKTRPVSWTPAQILSGSTVFVEPTPGEGSRPPTPEVDDPSRTSCTGRWASVWVGSPVEKSVFTSKGPRRPLPSDSRSSGPWWVSEDPPSVTLDAKSLLRLLSP